MSQRSSSLAGLFVLASSACSPGVPPSSSVADSAASTEEPSKAPPQLVVLLVLDQFGEWVLEHHQPFLPKDGFLATASREGQRYLAEFPFACTMTAAGHASIATGRTPAEHGIYTNSAYDPEHKAIRALVDDGTHEVIGAPGQFASPRRRQGPDLASVLLAQPGLHGTSKVVSLSLKDRGAVLLAGAPPSLALFYRPELPGFTSSTYYLPSKELPAWVKAFNKSHPIDRALTTWEAQDPAALTRQYGEDRSAGKGQLAGSSRFPYNLKQAQAPYRSFVFTPPSASILLELAQSAIAAEKLGQDDSPDLLTISVSTPDYVGHVFGPQSWEYADSLQRLDRELADFATQLRKESSVVFVLTADHGVAPFPERNQGSALGSRGGRLNPEQLLKDARSAAEKALGPGDWIERYAGPLLSYTPQGRAQRARLDAALTQAFADYPGVRGGYSVEQASQLRASADRIEALIGNSLPASVSGDFYLLYAPGWIAAPTGTSHGTPWDYDRQVPIVVWGEAITPGRHPEPVDQRRLAPSVAQLLGLDPSLISNFEVLPGLNPA